MAIFQLWAIMTDGKRRGHFEGSGGWRKDGRYSWRITLPDGKRRSFYGKTKREAVAKAKQAELDFERGAVVGARDVTVKAFLERWLKDTAADRVRPSTLRSYRGHIERHILPAFGTVKLRTLTPQHVNAMLAAIVTGGASPTTANRVRATLRTALASAFKWGMVNRNVATLADPRREERQRITPLQPNQLRAFLATLQGHRYEPLLTVAIATGMRQGSSWRCAGGQTSTSMPPRSGSITRCRSARMASVTWAVRRPNTACESFDYPETRWLPSSASGRRSRESLG